MLKFSVLLSVYRKEQPLYFRQCFDSLMAQTLQPNEIVLVKDGELTPELEEVITEYQQKLPILKTVSLETNQGLGKALNEGLKHCSHELVARMDTDDICKPKRFEVQIGFMEKHPEIDVCSACIDEFEGDKSCVVNKKELPECHDDIIRYSKKRSPINHPVVIYKKSKVLAAGGYNGFPEDYYLWVKMIMAGCRFHNMPESLLWFRFDSSVIKRRGGWSYAKDDLRTQKEFYKMSFLSKSELIRNVIVRGTVRLMPNNVRGWIYRHLLRKNVYAADLDD